MATESPRIQTPTSFGRDGESEKYLAQRAQRTRTRASPRTYLIYAPTRARARALLDLSGARDIGEYVPAGADLVVNLARGSFLECVTARRAFLRKFRSARRETLRARKERERESGRNLS